MDRNKVIKGLSCCRSGAQDSVHDGALRACHKCPYGQDYPCTSRLAADALELLTAPAAAWISVEDRLPECDKILDADGVILNSSEYVLVYGTDPDGDRVLGIANYLTDPNDPEWTEWDGTVTTLYDAINCDITHWARIPRLPKEGEDEKE